MTISRRAWTIPGQKTKHRAWGFSVTVDGKRIKSYRDEWTKDDAKAAEANALLKIETTTPGRRVVSARAPADVTTTRVSRPPASRAAAISR